MPIDPADTRQGRMPVQLRQGVWVLEELRVLDEHLQLLGMLFVRYPHDAGLGLEPTIRLIQRGSQV